jgi:hypothetical protein
VPRLEWHRPEAAIVVFVLEGRPEEEQRQADQESDQRYSEWVEGEEVTKLSEHDGRSVRLVLR